MKIGSKFVNSILFQNINYNINEEVDKILSSNKNKKSLNETYKKSYDVFMLGMTIIHAMFILKYNVFYNEYIILIRKFVSLIDPVKDPKEALEIAKNHFKSRNIKYD